MSRRIDLLKQLIASNKFGDEKENEVPVGKNRNYDERGETTVKSSAGYQG